MKSRNSWPIVPWTTKDGTKMFRLEDPEGYNFSYATHEDAWAVREVCFAFNFILETTELKSPMTGVPARRVPKTPRIPVDSTRDSR